MMQGVGHGDGERDGEGRKGAEGHKRVHVGGAVAGGAPGGGVDLRRGKQYGAEGKETQDPTDGLSGKGHQRRGQERRGEVHEPSTEWIGAGDRICPHQRHGQDHGDGTGGEAERGAQAKRGIVIFFGGLGLPGAG